MGSLAGPKPEENHHPAPSLAAPTRLALGSLRGPVGTDKGLDVHHSGEWQGGGEKPAAARGCGGGRLGCGVAARDLCFSGGRWVGSRASGAGVRPGPGWVGEVAVQGGPPQSRLEAASAPSSHGLSSVALKGAGHTASPRHFLVCLGSWAPWRLGGRPQTTCPPVPLRLSLCPRTDPRRGQGPPLLPEAWACLGSLRNSTRGDSGRGGLQSLLPPAGSSAQGELATRGEQEEGICLRLLKQLP